MQRFLLAFCAALMLMVAAVSPTFAQQPTRGGAETRSPGLELMRAMQADPATSRTMVFIVVEDDESLDKIAAEAEEGGTETTVCNKTVCTCHSDAHGSCDLFAWLCGKLGGQHTQGASVEGCFF